MDYYAPTPQIKWFRVEAGNTEKVCGITKGDVGLPDEQWCLKQLWVSGIQGELDEWRDVECVA